MIVNNNLYICNMEIYKDIKGFEGRYQVSNLGNVKSLGRIVKHSNGGDKFINEKILKPRILHSGYFMCVLSKDANKKCLIVHRLVAEAFIANPENKPQVNHINGIKTDNRVENLEWNTRSENLNHAVKNNLLPSGTKSTSAIFDNEQISLIRNSKLSQRKLAKILGCSKTTIGQIRRKQTYKNE